MTNDRWLAHEIINTFSEIFDFIKVDGYLVGGAVRDIYMGLEPCDFDFVCEIDERKHLEAAQEISKILECQYKYNNYYHTAKLYYKGQVIDFIMARSETYSGIAAKPAVKSSCIYEDLKRRDYTINTIAVRLKKDNYEMLDSFNGIQDIENKKLRILHSQSFRDDPTRIFRGIKYASRFGFSFDNETEECINTAVLKGYIGFLGGARIRQEIETLLMEDNCLDAVSLINSFNLFRGLVNCRVYVNTHLDKNKFVKLNSNDKMAALFYRNNIDAIKSVKEFLNLSSSFLDTVIKIKSIEDVLYKEDFEVYSFLFRNSRGLREGLLEIILGYDKRIMNYIKYKDIIGVNRDIIEITSVKHREDIIAAQRAANLISYMNGGQ